VLRPLGVERAAAEAHELQVAACLSRLRAAIQDSERRRAAEAEQKRLNAGPVESRQQAAARARQGRGSPGRNTRRAQKLPRMMRKFYKMQQVDSPGAAALAASDGVRANFHQLLRRYQRDRLGVHARGVLTGGLMRAARFVRAFISPLFVMTSMLQPVSSTIPVLPSPRIEPSLGRPSPTLPPSLPPISLWGVAMAAALIAVSSIIVVAVANRLQTSLPLMPHETLARHSDIEGAQVLDCDSDSEMPDLIDYDSDSEMPDSKAESLSVCVTSCDCGCRRGLGWPLPQRPPSPVDDHLPPSPPSPPPMVAEESDGDLIGIRRAEIAALSQEEYDQLERSCMAQLEMLPNVTAVNAFHRGSHPNQRGVKVTLNCTRDCKQEQQPQQRCRSNIPTRAQAAEILLGEVTKNHAECISDRRRWCRGEPSAARNAFTHITEAKRKASEVEASNQRVKACHQDVVTAKAHVAAAQERELQAVKEREASEAALAEVKASVRQGKSTRTEDVHDASALDVDDVEVEAADPDAWESYSLQMFRSLFRKYQTTSTQPVDPSNTDTGLPSKGDDDGRRGWRNHKIRGMYRAVRHWANGSPFRVAFMLAELIIYFGVQDAVSVPVILGSNVSAILGSMRLPY
jgi:hypothetical protein